MEPTIKFSNHLSSLVPLSPIHRWHFLSKRRHAMPRGECASMKVFMHGQGPLKMDGLGKCLDEAEKREYTHLDSCEARKKAGTPSHFPIAGNAGFTGPYGHISAPLI
uniref:Uncharacterized protein n=1 Tax=Romanomermis culicivorax TaxID=13658 RepID=A0A915J6T2_ROMCU